MLVNELQLELGDTGNVLYAWGMCAQASWRLARLELPAARPGLLWPEQLPPVSGTSLKLNEVRWPVSADSEVGCVCVGDSAARGEAVRFAPGAVAVIADGVLLALWLCPQLLRAPEP